MNPSTKHEPKASRPDPRALDPDALGMDGPSFDPGMYADRLEVGPACTLPVDHDSLAKAIRRGRAGMRSEDARTIAAHVLNFFGFNERIIDNVLEPDDRDTFYMLEDSGILETERDETTLYDGREWRIHYWLIRKERILELAREEAQAMAAAGESEVIYSTHVSRSGPFPLPHGETGTGLAAHAVYHELGDDIWFKRREELSEEEPPEAPSPLERAPTRASR